MRQGLRFQLAFLDGELQFGFEFVTEFGRDHKVLEPATAATDNQSATPGPPRVPPMFTPTGAPFRNEFDVRQRHAPHADSKERNP